MPIFCILLAAFTGLLFHSGRAVAADPPVSSSQMAPEMTPKWVFETGG